MRWKALMWAPAFLAVAALTCSGLAALSTAAPSPSPNPIPAMALTLYPSGVTAHPTNVLVGVAPVEGSLVMDKIPGERLIANLRATTDRGWPVQCSPSALVFYNNKVGMFTATVAVPVGTPANQVGILTIEVEARGQTFTLRTLSQAIVTVAPYYVFFINSPMPYKEVTPAKPVVFEVELDNWGNSEDSYELQIQNQDELAAKGWTVSLSTSTAMRVGSMQAKFLKMSVQPAFSSTLYKAESTVIMVEGTSQNSQYGGGEIKTAMLPFIVYERGTYIDLAAAGSAGLSICLILLVVVPVGIGVRRLRRRFKKKQG
jgi:hypothetical protein